MESGEIIEPLRDRIVGRVTLEKIVDPFGAGTLVEFNDEIDEDKASAVQEAGIEKVKIRSVLTCASRRGVCVRCYGRDWHRPARRAGPGGRCHRRAVDRRTRHAADDADVPHRRHGVPHFRAEHARRAHGHRPLRGPRRRRDAQDGQLIVMNRNGSLVIKDEKGRDRERYPIVYGARLKVKDGQKVDQGQVIVEWDPYVLDPHRGTGNSEVQGHHRGHDRSRGGRRGHRPVALHHRRLAGREEAADDRDQGQGRQGHPQVLHAVARAPDGAGRRDGEAGDVLAKIPRETTKTKDITGGLPRVVELFEARKPKDPAVISEIDGVVKDGGVVKGQRKLIIVPDDGAEPREHRCRAACTSTCTRASGCAPASS